MIRAVPARPRPFGPEHKQIGFQELGDTVDGLSAALGPLVGGLVLRPLGEVIRPWQHIVWRLAMLRHICEGLDHERFGPAMRAASVWCPGGIPARALAVHGIARLGLSFALHGCQA